MIQKKKITREVEIETLFCDYCKKEITKRPYYIIKKQINSVGKRGFIWKHEEWIEYVVGYHLHEDCYNKTDLILGEKTK